MLTIGTPGGASFDVVRATICLPRIGAWHADLEADGTTALTGRVNLQVGTAALLSGSIVRGEVYGGTFRARVTAGAGGLSANVTARHYRRPALRTVLADLAADAGEALSATIAAALLNSTVDFWTTPVAPAGQALRAFVEKAAPVGTAWRYLTDGTIWVGAETWPESTVEVVEVASTPEDAVLELGADQPFLDPGTVIGGKRADYVEVSVDAASARLRVWWTT
jgi:hypothetical protein